MKAVILNFYRPVLLLQDSAEDGLRADPALVDWVKTQLGQAWISLSYLPVCGETLAIPDNKACTDRCDVHMRRQVDALKTGKIDLSSDVVSNKEYHSCLTELLVTRHLLPMSFSCRNSLRHQEREPQAGGLQGCGMLRALRYLLQRSLLA